MLYRFVRDVSPDRSFAVNMESFAEHFNRKRSQGHRLGQCHECLL